MAMAAPPTIIIGAWVIMAAAPALETEVVPAVWVGAALASPPVFVTLAAAWLMVVVETIIY